MTGPVFDPAAAHAFLRLYQGLPGAVALSGQGQDGAWIGGQRFGTDDAGLAAAADCARQGHDAGWRGVYFRTTTMRTDAPGRGGALDAVAVPVLWADVDFGTEGHERKAGLPPLPPDADAARAVIAESGLPEPSILVHTGGGLDPFWRVAGLTPESAARYSAGVQDALKTAATAHGWDYGTGVGDLARVLRLPGSVNRKTNNHRLCQMIGGTGLVHPVSAFPVRQEMPRPATSPYVRPQGASPSVDELFDGVAWSDILPDDWTSPGTDVVNGVECELWRRPGASSEYSARVLPGNDGRAGVLFMHSENGEVPQGKHNRVSVWAHLHWSGNVEAARGDLRAALNGGGSDAARGLPDEFLDALGPPAPIGSLPAPSSSSVDPAPSSSTDPAPEFLRLPAEFWGLSPLLSHICRAAAARDASPDAVLHALLAGFASGLPHGTVLDGALGTDPLHHFVASIGASGSGKSLAHRVARELLTPSGEAVFGHVGTRIREVPIGSGQGMVEAFMGDAVETRRGPDGQVIMAAPGIPATPGTPGIPGTPRLFRVRKQTEHNALFLADEGRQVLSIGAARESMVFPTLCSLWSGEKTGQANATPERSRSVEAGSYAVGAVLGFQPETIAALFSDEAGGTPQRFLFADAIPPWSLDAPLPAWPGPPLLPTFGHPVTVTMAAEVRADAVAAQRLLTRGLLAGSGPLDGHVIRVRARVAALLALLHGGTEVTAEWWKAAQIAVDASRALRDHTQRTSGERAREARLSGTREVATADAESRAVVAQRIDAQRVETTARRIVEIAGRLHAAGERPTIGHVARRLGKAQREVRGEALDHAVTSGWATVTPDGDVIPTPPTGGTS